MKGFKRKAKKSDYLTTFRRQMQEAQDLILGCALLEDNVYQKYMRGNVEIEVGAPIKAGGKPTINTITTVMYVVPVSDPVEDERVMDAASEVIAWLEAASGRSYRYGTFSRTNPTGGPPQASATLAAAAAKPAYDALHAVAGFLRRRGRDDLAQAYQDTARS